jgi:DNA polymerase III alpha subunit
MNLEDETGMVNVLCSPGVWARHRRLAQTASALLVRGIVQNASGAVTVVADRMAPLSLERPRLHTDTPIPAVHQRSLVRDERAKRK